MQLQVAFDAARVALSISFFAYASWSDYKTREVSNNVWIFFAPLALALSLTEFIIYSRSMLVSYGICIALMTGLALLLFYANAFGGADAKALMCLALALPFFPSTLLGNLFQASPISQLFFPITVFSNGVILVFVPVTWILLKNLAWRLKTKRPLFEGEQSKESKAKKLLVLITGFKVHIDTLKEKWHVYPLEDIENQEGNGFKRKLVLMPKDEGRSEIIDRLDGAIQSGKIDDGIWGSPGLPMLILLTVGLVAALFFGDIVWTIISAVLH